MTISGAVLVYLKEQPGTAEEIAKAIDLKKRDWRGGNGYNWGWWSFSEAEDDGLIEWKEGKWHLKGAEG